MHKYSSIKFFVFILLIVLFSCNNREKKMTDSFWNDKKSVAILNFETPNFNIIKPKHSKLSITEKKGVTQGNKALKINFKADEKYSGIEFSPKEVINITQFKNFNLVFDASNFGEHSTHLYVIVENDKGEQRKRSVSIPVGTTNTYFFELHGKYLSEGNDTNLRDNPNPWKKVSNAVQMKMRGRIIPIDFSIIAKIQFFTKNTLFDKEVVLDNIKIVESPEYPKEYLTRIIDKYGQNAKDNFEGKITSDEQLKQLATRELETLAKEGTMSDRSKYGGWKSGPKLKATGYFRTEKIGNKWALVDPEGHLFFSSGIANVRMANTTTFTGIDFKNDTVRYRDPKDVTPEDSKGMVKLPKEVTESAYVAYPTRNQFFEELPSYDSPLANHYSYRREQHFGPFAHGETFSFYQANLERRYGEPTEGAHLEKWIDVTYQRFLNWGFTSFGNWIDTEFYQRNRMPYFANGWIIGDFKKVKSGFDFWGEMPDVYDPEFKRRAIVTVKVIAKEVKNNPWCIGVFIDNEKSWGVPGSIKGQYGIIIDALSNNSFESPIKDSFTKTLQKKYKTIEKLNTSWKTTISNWKSFQKGINLKNKKSFSTGMVMDFSILLEAYGTKYFQIVHDALQKDLPNHLYFGCRFAHWGMGKELFKAAEKYVDVFSYNYYEEGIGKKEWTFLEEIDKPAIIGEFHIGTSSSGLFHHGVIHAADHQDRAKMYKDYLYSVVDNPYFVGAHWFQYIDSPVSGRAHDGENYNVGFVTNTDIPYPTMVKAAKEIHKNIYERRFGKSYNQKIQK